MKRVGFHTIITFVIFGANVKKCFTWSKLIFCQFQYHPSIESISLPNTTCTIPEVIVQSPYLARLHKVDQVL